MKKNAELLLISLLLICSGFLLSPMTAKADIGPKPSVRITFENMGDEICYGTLLSKTSSTGPSSVWDGSPANIRNYNLDTEIWEAFVNYQDSDGYYFLQEGWLCSETKQLNWTYYPPETFKILLYYPETDTFVVSGIYERYAFDSYYTVDMAQVNTGGAGTEPAASVLTAETNYDYTWELISLVCRILLTILLEVGIAFLFGFRQKELLRLIAGINIVTQVVLNVLLNLIRYYQGQTAFVLSYILFEMIVFIIEAAFYSILFGRVGRKAIPIWKSVVYAFVANAVSFGAGFLIAKTVPGIF